MKKIGVIGGGLSGLLISYLLLEGGGVSLSIFERESRFGGKIYTVREGGFLLENGPNGFLNSKPETLKIVKMLGIESELYEAEDSAEDRFILKGGKLVKVPLSPEEFIFSPILSPWGKLRLLGEFFKGVGEDESESVEDFVVRRLGREVFERLIDPMVSGIYAGDPTRMEMKASFPVIYNLERNYGGLLKGMFKIKRDRKDVSASPSGRLTTFKGGLSFFIDRISKEILDRGGKIFLNSSVKRVEKKEGGFYLYTQEESHYFDILIFAIPAYECGKLLRSVDPFFGRMAEDVEYSPLVVVHFGYGKESLEGVPEGFGFLVPFIEGRKILGSIFISSIFKDGRAPDGMYLFTTMVGGARWMDVCRLSEGDIESIVMKEFKEILNISKSPHFKKIVKWERAIPQYNIGHSKTMEYARNFHKKNKNVYIMGNAFRGIGINDISKAAFEVFEEFLKVKNS